MLDIAIEETDVGIEVRMAIALERVRPLKERRRNLTGRTGCGLCGVESLEQAMRPCRAGDGRSRSADRLDAVQRRWPICRGSSS